MKKKSTNKGKKNLQSVVIKDTSDRVLLMKFQDLKTRKKRGFVNSVCLNYLYSELKKRKIL